MSPLTPTSKSSIPWAFRQQLQAVVQWPRVLIVSSYPSTVRGLLQQPQLRPQQPPRPAQSLHSKTERYQPGHALCPWYAVRNDQLGIEPSLAHFFLERAQCLLLRSLSCSLQISSCDACLASSSEDRVALMRFARPEPSVEWRPFVERSNVLRYQFQSIPWSGFLIPSVAPYTKRNTSIEIWQVCRSLHFQAELQPSWHFLCD